MILHSATAPRGPEASVALRTGPADASLPRDQCVRHRRGVKLVTSDAHEGLKAAITKVLTATWQRCRVHFMRASVFLQRPTP